MIKLYQKWAKVSFALVCFGIFGSTVSKAQIYAPEGLNMPGDWNGWGNPPAANSPFGSEFQVTNGGMKKLTTGTTRWQTTFQAPNTGPQGFLFTSGPTGSPWNNKWGDVAVTLNTLQTYNFSGGAGNNSCTTTSGKYYTMNWRDNGYSSTQAIFMETTNAPVTVSSVNQSPVAGSVTPADPVDVTVTTSAAPSPEEKVYIRYTIDNFTTSNMLLVTMVGNSGTAQIPAQADGTTVQYYVMTSTVSGITANYDMLTIRAGTLQNYTSAAAPPINITFRVDMQNETVSGNGVHLAGTFNGFNTSSILMTQVGATSVYEATVSIAQNSAIEYKFLNGNTGSDYETVTGGCQNGGGNRTYTTGTGDATIGTVCYGKCSNCVPKVNVKFQVNMAGLTVSGNGVHIAGDFGSNYPVWTPGAIALSDQGGGIYAVTLQLVPGQIVNYKFINGNAWGADEGVPGACNVFGNRQFTVPAGGGSTPLICFGTCGNCVPVTFRVDMSNVSVSGNGVHVAGAFQGWNPGSTQLNFVGGGVYSVTVNMDPGTSSEFKFVNGNAWGSDEGIPGVCQVNGNRFFTVGSTPLVLPVVCFGRCIGCTDQSVWTGAQNNSFSNGNNWTSGVAPTGCDFNLKINDVANAPVLSGGTFTAGSLTIAPGASLTLNGTSVFNVCGSLTAQGFDPVVSGTGSLVMNGTSSQTITGNLGVDRLTINNPAGVNLASGSTVKVHSALKLNAGTFNASAGNLILQGTTAGDARLLKIEPTASLVGSIKYRKVIAPYNPSNTGAWYFATSPVGGFALNSFDQAGNNFHPSTFDPASENPSSLYLYNNVEVAGNSDEFGWIRSNNPAQTVAAGKGVRVWAKSSFINGQGYFEFSGAPNTGTVNYGVSQCNSGCSYAANGAVNGWNFLGNPYPCPIDWNAATGWTKSNIAGNAIYVWNAASEVYSTFDGAVGSNGGSRYIGAGQAFFINAGAGASLQSNEDVKADQATVGMRANVAEISGIRVKFESAGKTDEAFVDFTDGRETAQVAKLSNPGINVGIVSGAAKLVFAGKGLFQNAIPLFFNSQSINGRLKISLEGTALEGAQVFLKDEVTSQIHPITEGFVHNFVAVGGDADRFSLIVTESVTGIKALQKGLIVFPNPTSDKLSVTVAGGFDGQVEILNLQGQVLSVQKIGATQSEISVGSLPAGQYMIRIPALGKVTRFTRN